MKKMKSMVALLLCLWGATGLRAADDGRQTMNWNFDWQFRRDEVKEWRTVDLPHDFQIEQPWVEPAPDERPDLSDVASNVRSRLSARGFKEMAIGWYRKEFTPDPSWQSRRVLIDFEGIMLVGDVFLNGQRIGGTDYGYLGFELDVTKLLKYGEPNELLVKADTGQPLNSRWYTGGGLYRDVHVVVTDPQVYLTRHALQIRTPQVESDEARVEIEAEIACLLPKNDTLRVEAVVRNAAGEVVARNTSSLLTNRGQRVREYALQPLTIAAPHLWNLDDPYLYEVEVTVCSRDGRVADRLCEHFGIRTLEYSPEFGLKLNGQKVLLKGIANHHTLGALGAAAYPRAMEKRIRLLKEFGFNHIRTAHNPYSRSLLDLCDRYGILVVDELYDKWTTQYAGGRKEWTEQWQEAVPEFVKRDRNHPCVVMWSLGNELQQIWDLPFHDWGVTIYRMMHTLLRRYDAQQRPVTVAMHPRYRDLEHTDWPAPLARVTDVAAYNYRYMYFPGDAKNFPHMMFYQSEANTSNMGPNFFEMDLDRVLGLAYWGMIDYLGESRGWPAKGWDEGIFDLSLEPKPQAWLVKSMFSDEPTVHIAVQEKGGETSMWNGVMIGTKQRTEHWNRAEGSRLKIFTYTNAEEVELRLNGRTLGRQANPTDNPKRRNQLLWEDVAYQPGRLEAIAYNQGKEVARHTIETAGKPVALKLMADPGWVADGTDLMHVRVVAVDKQGRRVGQEAPDVHFTVEGDARIVAVGNGDINSDELSLQDHRRLWNGSALVILRAGRTAGQVTLTASAPGFKTVKLKLKTE